LYAWAPHDQRAVVQVARNWGRSLTLAAALMLVRQYDVIYHEELRVANLVRNHHLAKSIADEGWSGFLTILSFKAASSGREVIAVDPAFTSQACSECGVIVQKGPSVRWHICPECGTSLHPDENAARNFQRREQRLRGVTALAGAMNRESVGL
jgi:putative transposase